MISWLWLITAFAAGFLASITPSFGVPVWLCLDSLTHPVAWLARRGNVWAQRRVRAQLWTERLERDRRYQEGERAALTGTWGEWLSAERDGRRGHWGEWQAGEWDG
jgi:hypothetical protein